MNSIDFPGATLKIGANQTDIYNVIHAQPLDGPTGEVVAIFELSDEELAEIIKTKKIYYSRLTFGGKCQCEHCGKITASGFQPMRLQTNPVEINVTMNDNDGNAVGEPVTAFITPDGLDIPGFNKMSDGRYNRIEAEA